MCYGKRDSVDQRVRRNITSQRKRGIKWKAKGLRWIGY